MTNIHIIDFQPSDWHHHSTHAIPSTLTEIIIRFRNLNETLIRRNFWDSSIVRYKSFASLWLTSLREFTNEYISTLEKIYPSLLFSMNNIWNPILIDSDKYTKILDDITLAKSEIHLPLNFTFSDLYQISKISIHNFENQLMFLLTIPLISNNEFKLYKVLRIINGFNPVLHYLLKTFVELK